MKNIKAIIKNDGITFEVNTKIYPKELVYKACYVFIDKTFIRLDVIKKNLIAVSLKSKENLNKKQLENIKGEFSNELLNILLRENISKRNQKILEYIVSGAITSSLKKGQAEPKGVLSPHEQENIKANKELEKAVESLRRELAKIDADDK